MPFYLRKSLTRGLFRLNLSKHGLGASVGVKGLRIGIGPKGTYLQGGRDGLYYRQSLNPKAMTPQTRALPQTHPYAAPDAPQAQPPGEAVEYAATPASGDDVASAINEQLRAFRWSRLLMWSAFILPLFVLFSRIYVLALLVFVGLLVGAIVLSSREKKDREINLSYDLGEAFGKDYDLFVHAFGEAAKSSAIWRITSRTAADAKYTGGADTTVERARTAITFNDPVITANVWTTWLGVAGGKLALLPDRMLFFGPLGVVSLDYKDVHVEASATNFREGETVPADSTNVGSTWQFVNKSGGPDRRFTNNRQVPIQRYSDLHFTHPKLAFRLEFSKAGVAEVLVTAIQGLVAAVPSLHANGAVGAGTTETPPSTPPTTPALADNPEPPSPSERAGTQNPPGTLEGKRMNENIAADAKKVVAHAQDVTDKLAALLSLVQRADKANPQLTIAMKQAGILPQLSAIATSYGGLTTSLRELFSALNIT